MQTLGWKDVVDILQQRNGKLLDHVWLMCCYSNNVMDDWFAASGTVWSYGPFNGITRFFANKESRPKNYQPSSQMRALIAAEERKRKKRFRK